MESSRAVLTAPILSATIAPLCHKIDLYEWLPKATQKALERAMSTTRPTITRLRRTQARNTRQRSTIRNSTVRLLPQKSIKVDGVCEPCEHTIEGTLKKSPAIFFADWDAGTKLLFVKYDRTKISVKKIEEMVAATGHNTANIKADSTAHKPLPDCCRQEKRSK